MNENYYPIIFDGGSFVINNEGTAPTPCKITIVPQISVVNLIIEGVSEKQISISNVNANDILVINGEDRAIIINGDDAFNKYNGWEFPKLQPGENTIRIMNGEHMLISIEFNERYL